MKYNSTLLFSTLVFLLNACASTPEERVDALYLQQGITAPEQRNFIHCHGYGCKHQKPITLSEDNWQKIVNTFKQLPNSDPESERHNISVAIGEFEKIVGEMANTSEDVRRSFLKLGRHQLDCVDESTNAITYMTVMRLNGLITYHDVLTPSFRFLENGLPTWPHQAATLIEKQSKDKYVVDSWFRDNGYPAFIVPARKWKLGWSPKKADMPELEN